MNRDWMSLLLLSSIALAQPGGGSPALRQASQLDAEGKYAEARQLIQKEIDGATDAKAKAQAQRVLALSFGFEGNCAQTIKLEEAVIGYWVTREKEEPANAFYQQGEMANEAARICIDAGKLDEAEKWYRKGTELGLKEPNLSADRKALWQYRLKHAEARLAARRGKFAEAEKYVAEAKALLDSMTTLKAQQSAFFPYLTGYVALYRGDAAKAVADLQQATQNDPFIQCLLGMAYEKLGEKDKAVEMYKKAAASRGHNPPAAFAIPFARKKLGQGAQ